MPQVPDWVVLGTPHGKRVAVFASKELTAAELAHELDRRDGNLPLGNWPVRPADRA